MNRIIGIRHRIKKTANGEAHPTQVAIDDGNGIKTYNLATETDELDWVKGQYPIKMRKVEEDEDLSFFPLHQVKTHILKKDEDPTDFPHNLIIMVGRNRFELATKVPEIFDGLTTGDTVVMVLGGSGDRLAAAIARRGQNISAAVMRIPGYVVKDRRSGKDSSQDHVELLKLYKKSPELFYDFGPRDANLIAVKENLRDRTDTIKARLACEQRIRTSMIGRIFTAPDGLFPEGSIEEMHLAEKANSTILAALLTEERLRDKLLNEAVLRLDIWEKLFEGIPGVGPRIAAGIIAHIGDIRRFPTAAKLKAYTGTHLRDGKFPRRRRGIQNNWNPTPRQSLYLLGDQFNRRPDSKWGKKLREYKIILREKHPQVIVENGKKRYTNGHIHKMASWRTLTKFVEWLWREWWEIEKAAR